MEAKGDIDREPKKHSGRGSLGRVGSHYGLHWEYQGQSTITECETVLCTTENTPQQRTAIVSWLQNIREE